MMNETTVPRVDFYLLAEESTQSLHFFCCRLAEKAWRLGHSVFIRTENEAETEALDALMWRYSEHGFLPHVRWGDEHETETPIIIASKIEPTHGYDLLINLASDIPLRKECCPRIAEIISADAERKQQGRLRYAQYEKNNYSLKHYNISNA